MTGRAYTVDEIDQLRIVVENKWLFGSYKLDGVSFSRSYKEEERAAAVEQMVRTHMFAGHTAQDLLDSEVAA